MHKPETAGVCSDDAIQSRRRFTEAEFNALNLDVANTDVFGVLANAARSVKESKHAANVSQIIVRS